MEGVAGICALGPGERGPHRLRGGPAALHRGAQRGRPRRVRGRRERGRGDGLPRRGRRLVVQLADPGGARRALRVRRTDTLDRVHGDARERLRRRAVRRPARARRQPSTACSRTRSARPTGTTCASTARSWARSGSTPRCAGPGARPSRSSPATTSSARRRASCSARACDTGGQAGPRPLLGPPPLPRARPRAARGRRRATRWRTSATRPVYDPGAPCTIEVELGAPDHADVFRHRADVELTDARTVRATAPTWWDAWRAIYLLARRTPATEQHRAVLAGQRHGHRPAVVVGGQMRATSVSFMFVGANEVAIVAGLDWQSTRRRRRTSTRRGPRCPACGTRRP